MFLPISVLVFVVAQLILIEMTLLVLRLYPCTCIHLKFAVGTLCLYLFVLQTVFENLTCVLFTLLYSYTRLQLLSDMWRIECKSYQNHTRLHSTAGIILSVLISSFSFSQLHIAHNNPNCLCNVCKLKFGCSFINLQILISLTCMLSCPLTFLMDLWRRNALIKTIPFYALLQACQKLFYSPRGTDSGLFYAHIALGLYLLVDQ